MKKIFHDTRTTLFGDKLRYRRWSRCEAVRDGWFAVQSARRRPEVKPITTLYKVCFPATFGPFRTAARIGFFLRFVFLFVFFFFFHYRYGCLPPKRLYSRSGRSGDRRSLRVFQNEKKSASEDDVYRHGRSVDVFVYPKHTHPLIVTPKSRYLSTLSRLTSPSNISVLVLLIRIIIRFFIVLCNTSFV